jgi:hypothetical protein
MKTTITDRAVKAAIFAIAILADVAAPLSANAETQCRTVCSRYSCSTVCREVYTQREAERDNYQAELRRLNRENRRCYDPSGC